MDLNGNPGCECPEGHVLNPDGISCDRSGGKSTMEFRNVKLYSLFDNS